MVLYGLPSLGSDFFHSVSARCIPIPVSSYPWQAVWDSIGSMYRSSSSHAIAAGHLAVFGLCHFLQGAVPTLVCLTAASILAGSATDSCVLTEHYSLQPLHGFPNEQKMQAGR